MVIQLKKLFNKEIERKKRGLLTIGQGLTTSFA